MLSRQTCGWSIVILTLLACESTSEPKLSPGIKFRVNIRNTLPNVRFGAAFPSASGSMRVSSEDFKHDTPVSSEWMSDYFEIAAVGTTTIRMWIVDGDTIGRGEITVPSEAGRGWLVAVDLGARSPCDCTVTAFPVTRHLAALHVDSFFVSQYILRPGDF